MPNRTSSPDVIRNAIRRVMLAGANHPSGWPILIAIFIIALMTASTVFMLRQSVDKHYKIVLLLAHIEVQANRLNALEWQAIADTAIGAHNGILPPEILEGMEDARTQIEQAFGELTRLDPEAEKPYQVSQAYHDYITAMDEEVRLVAAGHIAEARRVDEEQVDPKFVILSEAIVKTNNLHNAMAQEMSQTADVWSLLTLSFAMGIIALLIWRFDRTRQSAQLAIVEQKILYESEKKYRTLVSEINDGFFTTDTSGIFTFANKALAGIYGCKDPGDLVGRTFLEFIAPELSDEIGKEFRKDMENGKTPEMREAPIVRKDGSIAFIEVKPVPVFEEGRLAGTRGVVRDITERKRAEEELVKLRKAVEASGEAMFLTDRDGLIAYVNPEFTRLYGHTADEVVGKVTPRILKSGLLKPEDYEIFWETILSKQVVKGEIINKTQAGRFVTIEGSASPILDEQGNIVGFLAVQHDIAERKRAEEALQESEKRFKSLFEDSPISLWEEDFSLVATYLGELRHSGVTDFRAWFENHPEAVEHCATMVKVVDVNKGTLKLYKAKNKEAFLAGLGIVFSEEAIPTFREELIALAEGKTRFEDEVVNQTLTGERIHIALSWAVAPGYEKTYSQVFVSINDITTRKRAEEKLAATVTELEQHNNEITLLNEMGDLLQTCQTIEEAGAVVAQSARKLFPNQSGALCLIAPSRNFVEAIATWGESPPQERVFTPDDCWALRRGQVHSVIDPRSGPLCKHVSQPVTNGYLCVPMMAQGETLGILHLRSGQPAASQTGQEQETLAVSQVQLAATLAEHIALALANLELHETLRQQAIRDPLTGLFNRRYMEETLERELRRAERRKVSLGIIMFDLDHFKKFNDTFGHPAGDVVLREIGAFLQTRVRVEDIACRYGGEEFLVILPEASLDDTRKRAEQLRKGIKQLHVRYHDQALGAVTVSLGVAVFPDHASTTEAIVRGADAALYRAKGEGRDRVVVAPGMNA